MAKEEELEQETPLEEETPPETPPQEPTLEELTTEVKRLEGLVEEKTKGFTTLQRDLSTEQRKAQEGQSIETSIQDLKDQMKMLAAIFASKSEEGEESLEQVTPARKQDLLQKFDELAKKQSQAAEQKRLVSNVASYQKRTEDLGLTESDEDYWIIEDLVTSGKLKLADIKLRKLEASKKPPETEGPSPQEDEDDKIKKAVLKYAQSEGWLKTDTGGPSASSMSAQEAMKEYIAGKITAEQAEKRGCVFD